MANCQPAQNQLIGQYRSRYTIYRSKLNDVIMVLCMIMTFIEMLTTKFNVCIITKEHTVSGNTYPTLFYTLILSSSTCVVQCIILR